MPKIVCYFAKLTFVFANSILPNCQNCTLPKLTFEPMIERTLKEGFDLTGWKSILESSMKSKDEIQ
jgi:hypothetical protein